MTYYSNEDSLKATFSDKEVTALIEDADGTPSEVRLEKAAKTAHDEINGYLGAAGYIVPVAFSVFPSTSNALNGKIQTLSDYFTAYYLAGSADLMKDVYSNAYAAGIAWLKELIAGGISLDLPLADVTGPGRTHIQSRPRVFVRNMKTVHRTLNPLCDDSPD